MNMPDRIKNTVKHTLAKACISIIFVVGILAGPAKASVRFEFELDNTQTPTTACVKAVLTDPTGMTYVCNKPLSNWNLNKQNKFNVDYFSLLQTIASFTLDDTYTPDPSTAEQTTPTKLNLVSQLSIAKSNSTRWIHNNTTGCPSVVSLTPGQSIPPKKTTQKKG